MFGIVFFVLFIISIILFIVLTVRNKVIMDGINMILFISIFTFIMFMGLGQFKLGQEKYHNGNIFIEEHIKKHYSDGVFIESDTTYTLNANKIKK